MSDDAKKKIDDLVKNYQKTISHLEKAKDGSPDQQHAAINAALNSPICCNACQAMSSFCVPDQTPSKCQGGCTVTSMVF